MSMYDDYTTQIFQACLGCGRLLEAPYNVCGEACRLEYLAKTGEIKRCPGCNEWMHRTRVYCSTPCYLSFLERSKGKAEARKSFHCQDCKCELSREGNICQVCYDKRQAGSPGTHTWAVFQIKTYGFRECIKMFHPDRGGTHDLMVAINNAYDEMKGR